MSLDNHLEKAKPVPIGRVKLVDFFIVKCTGICFRHPYDFVYQEMTEDHSFIKVRKNKQFNPLGYCPVSIQWTLEYLLSYAKGFSHGSKWHRQLAKRTKKPKDKHCYPIARMVHFEIDLEVIGLFAYTIVRKSKYRLFYAKRRKK
jgi:hypothetical protein